MKPLYPDSFEEINAHTHPHVLTLHIPLLFCQVEVVHDDIMYQHSAHMINELTMEDKAAVKREMSTLGNSFHH